MAELRYLWSAELRNGLYATHDDEVVLLDSSQQTIASRDVASGLNRGFKLSLPHNKANGPPILALGVVTDEARHRQLAVLHSHGCAERWSMDTVQLEGAFSWKVKSNFEVAAVSKRPGDMLGFLASRSPNMPLQCIRLDTGAVSQSRLDTAAEKPRGQIVQMLCHPKQPWLFISYNKGAVQIWDYSAARAAGTSTASGQTSAAADPMGGYGGSYGGGDGGAGGGTEGGTDMMSEEQDVQTVVTAQLALVGVIRSPISGDAGGATCMQFHPSENLMLCVFGGTVMATYDLTPLAAGISEAVATGSIRSGAGKDKDSRVPIHKLEPLASTVSLPRNWLMTAAAFDPNSPIVYTAVQRQPEASRRRQCLLAAHTLLEPSLRVCLTVPVRGLVCASLSVTSCGQLLYLCQDGMQDSKANSAPRLRLHALDVMHPAESPWGKAVVCTRAPLHPDAFVQPARLPRFAYYIRQSQALSTAGLRPIATSASVYRHRIGSSTLRKGSQKPEHCFDIPSTVSDQSKSQTTQIEGILRDGPFLPIRLRAATDGSCFLVVGSVIAPVATDEHRSTMLDQLLGCPDGEIGNHELIGAFPAVALAFIPPSNGGADVQTNDVLRPSFFPCRDAIFWVAPSRPDSPEHTQGETIMCLNQDGTKVFWLSRSGDLLSSWIPRLPLLRLYGSSMRGSHPALLVSFRRRDVEYVCVSASPELLEHTSRWFQCRPHERVLDAQWQPIPSVYQRPDAGPEELDAHRPWIVHRAGALVAVLTTQRVLILSPELEVLTELEVTPTVAKVESIFWVGLAVLMVRGNGVVEYLLPSHLPTAAIRIDESQPYTGPFKAALCSLPTGRAVALVTCLPDRLVYCSQLPQRQLGEAVLSRPCIAVEPLALGLISAVQPLGVVNRRDTSAEVLDPHATQRAALLKTLILSYCYPKQAFGVSARTDNGAHPTTHATERLTKGLLLAGHAELASVLTGLQTSSHEFSQTYEARAWLPRETRFDVAAAVNRFDEGVMETLSSDPGLQELYLEPESLGAGGLPHPKARSTRAFRHMSRVLAGLGAVDVASKVADMAGDDVMLASYLCSQTASAASTSVDDLNALASANQARNPHLANFFEALASQPEAVRSASPPPISSNNAGGAARRTTLLHMSSQLERRSVIGGSVTQADVGTLHREHDALFTQTGLRLGPKNKALDVLAADSVEDYMGRTVMECVELEMSTSPLSPGGTHPTTAAADLGEPAEQGGGVDRSSWVEGVGKGRGEDRVVGYWRFGDIVKPGSEGFVSTGEPAARANMPDLTRFGNVAELVSEGARVSVAESQSPVDQGENSVKNAFDVIFNSTPLDTAAGVSVGLRCNVQRGAALDIGFYHDDTNRSRFTLEMWVRRDDEVSLEGGAPHVLAARALPADNKQFAAATMWSVLVDKDGYLTFRVGGTLPGCDTKTALPAEELKSESPSIGIGLWTHIAVVVDSSLSDYIPFVAGKPYEPQRAAVSLFVNGDRQGGNTLQLPPLTESQLSQTLLYFGYNLTSWKMTEVRMWATLRSDLDIVDAKENYLQLASSHKRLTIKMSASSRSSSTFASTPGTMLEPPQGGVGAAGRLSLPRGSLSTASLPIAPPSALLSAPGDSSRPSRRQKTRRSLASNAQSFNAFSSTPGVAAPVPPAKEGSALDTVKERHEQEPGQPEEGSTLQVPDHPPPPVPPKPAPAPPTQAAIGEGVCRIGQLHDAQVDLVDVLRDIRSTLLSSSSTFAVCISGKSSELDGLCVMDTSPASNALTFARFKIQAESVIMSPIQSSKVIGMYARGVLAVFDITTKRKVAEQKMAAPLVYWAWLDVESIILVLSNAVFKWTIQFGEGSAISPPVKLFDREDIDRSSPSGWSQRRVLQFGQSHDGQWAYVLSSERHRPEHPVDQLELSRTSKVAIHHLGSGDGAGGREAKVVDAVAAAFCEVDGQTAVLLVKANPSTVSLHLLANAAPLMSEDDWQSCVRWTVELPAHEAVGSLNFSHLSPSVWAWPIDIEAIVLSYDGTLHRISVIDGSTVQPAKLLTSEGLLSASMRVDSATNRQYIFALGRESGVVYCLPAV